MGGDEPLKDNEYDDDDVDVDADRRPLVLLLLLWNLFFGLRAENLAVRAISALVLISCLVENAILDAFPSATTVAWIFTLFCMPLCQLPNSTTKRVNAI